MFVHQMSKSQSKGKHIAMDTSVQVEIGFVDLFGVRSKIWGK